MSATAGATPIAFDIAGDTLLVDGMGSVRQEMVGSSVETATTYTPFGEVLEQTGTSGTVYGFTGEQEDSATGLLYLRARYYSPYLNRFISADTIVPDREDPQSFNRYAYARNNPSKYVDYDGHCWGVASFIRNWNIDTPWGTIGGATNCANIDTALQLVTDPDVPVEDRILPAAVVGGFGVATVYGAAGATGLAWSAIKPCATAATTILGGLAADGDPTNEISTLAKADLLAVQQFANKAIDINAARGFGSFGHLWNQMSQAMVQAGTKSNMILAKAGGQITGMMRVRTDTGVYQVTELEGIGGGAGTDLLMHAFQDSLARGFNGVYLYPVNQAVDFYARFPGYQTLPNGQWFWSAEALQALLASLGG